MKPTIVDTRATRLAAALGARDMTRADLAHLLGCTVPSIARWVERPASPRPGPPQRATTEAIATALDLDPAALEPGGPWGPLVGLPEDEVARMRRELAEWETMPVVEVQP